MNTPITDLCERLRATRVVGVPAMGAPQLSPELVNPDGPEAATALEQQAAERSELEGGYREARRLLGAAIEGGFYVGEGTLAKLTVVDRLLSTLPNKDTPA